MGHQLKVVNQQGNAHTIVVDRAAGVLHGVADARRATSKASGD
jgi:gamma-glutamyltranspeptidase/glutathione hydrolase